MCPRRPSNFVHITGIQTNILYNLIGGPGEILGIYQSLGEDCQLSSCEGRVRYPGSPAQHLHADASVTGSNAHPAPAADVQRGLGRITRHVLGMNAVFCLSDFRADQGTTLVLDGTHALPGTELPPESELRGPGRGTLVEADAGSVLLIGAR